MAEPVPLTPAITPEHAALMFPALTRAQIARVAAHGTARPIRRGEVLVEVGDRPVPFFVVRSGEIQIIRPSKDGDSDALIATHGPGASDLPVVRLFSRAGYRPLLEAGVRVFEWNGPMLHAKTAVADGRWARVGSSNLNIASWMGNRELDVIVEDEPFARRLEASCT